MRRVLELGGRIGTGAVVLAESRDGGILALVNVYCDAKLSQLLRGVGERWGLIREMKISLNRTGR